MDLDRAALDVAGRLVDRAVRVEARPKRPDLDDDLIRVSCPQPPNAPARPLITRDSGSAGSRTTHAVLTGDGGGTEDLERRIVDENLALHGTELEARLDPQLVP